MRLKAEGLRLMSVRSPRPHFREVRPAVLGGPLLTRLKTASESVPRSIASYVKMLFKLKTTYFSVGAADEVLDQEAQAVLAYISQCAGLAAKESLHAASEDFRDSIASRLQACIESVRGSLQMAEGSRGERSALFGALGAAFREVADLAGPGHPNICVLTKFRTHGPGFRPARDGHQLS